MLLPLLTDLTAIVMSPAARPLPSPEFLAFPAGPLCSVQFFVAHMYKVWLYLTQLDNLIPLLYLTQLENLIPLGR